MHVRPINRADIGKIVPQVNLDSFMDDEMNAFLWPHRREFPVDYNDTLVGFGRARFVTPGVYGAVCVADSEDAAAGISVAPGTLLGMSWWERVGASKDYKGRRSAVLDDEAARAAEKADLAHNTGLFTMLERSLLNVEGRYRDLVSPDRSASPDALRVRAETMSEGDNVTEALPGAWQLDLLGVHPSAQRRGVGGRLVEWGMEKAQAEGIPCVLSASGDGVRLYERYGFRIVHWLGAAIKRDWVGGAIMIWDPWGIWTESLPEGEKLYHGRRINARIKGWTPVLLE